MEQVIRLPNICIAFLFWKVTENWVVGQLKSSHDDKLQVQWWSLDDRIDMYVDAKVQT